MLEDSDKCLRGLTMHEKPPYLNLTEINGHFDMLLRCFWKAPSVRRNVGNIPGVMESWQLQKYFTLRQSKQNKCII